MLGGKDWDKFLTCEGCGNRPTQCSCRKDECRTILQTIGLIIVFATIVGLISIMFV